MFKNPFSLRSGLCFLILALLSAVGLTGCTPGRIASLAEKIADFDLPEGYSPELGIEADGYILVGYAPKAGQGHIYMFQAPASAGLDANELQAEIQKYRPDLKSGRTSVMETRPINIRGQQVSLVISEGTNSDGKPYLEYTAVFQGKTGPALVSITSVEANWSEADITAFLAAIQ